MKQEISQNSWAPVNENMGSRASTSDVGTVPGTVDDRALKQIRLPTLKMGFHQRRKSQAAGSGGLLGMLVQKA